MTDEDKPELPHEPATKKFDVATYFKSWRRIDWIALAVLIIFVILVSIPVYLPKGGCEVARPGYKCESAKNVLIEHCNYWGNWSCDTSADVSLPQVEWYIGNLCKIHNQYHSDKLDCSNLKLACNQATQNTTCPLG
ncbi:MAG: hypothetical protein QW751_00145 [Candidatus Aenigmatarchaeota archaeon]|nr:hypothetical protein [Candidatus Aenigmarchaeota archaeon]